MVIYVQFGFNEVVDCNGFKVYSGECGVFENVGEFFEVIYFVICINFVIGWKSVFVVGYYVQKINGFSEEEFKYFFLWFVQFIVENYDFQVCYKWCNVNDLVIWDN